MVAAGVCSCFVVHHPPHGRADLGTFQEPGQKILMDIRNR